MSSPVLKAENRTSEAAPAAKKAAIAPEAAHETTRGEFLEMGHSFGNISVHSPEIFSASPLRLQPKLVINQPGDVYEQEADAMADKVMRMPENSFGDELALKPAVASSQSPSNERKETIQRKESNNSSGPIISPSVEQTVRAAGQPLDGLTRSFMEQRFGYDFGNVRIHNDVPAHKSATEINARAYTHDKHVVFGPDQYQPATNAGKTLLAHELTHVLQQTAASRRKFEPSSSPAGAAMGRQSSTDSGQRSRPAAGNSGGQIARQPAPLPASPLTIPSEGVDMPWVGKGNASSSELGYLRDAPSFWRSFQNAYPAQLSPANRALIAGGRSPVVDAVWVQFHPGHAGYVGDVLEHHHVGQGSRAVPLPSRLHDAQTVFHPQRRVVGTPRGGTRPLPAQPTRAQAQEEIDRHVRAGRIRGPGVSTQSPPQAPAVPPASEVAGRPPAVPASPAEPEVAVPAPQGGALKNVAIHVGLTAATVALGLLESYIKSKLDEKQINKGIAAQWSTVQQQINGFAAQIEALRTTPTTDKIYGVIQVTVVRGRTFTMMGDAPESVAVVESLTVSEISAQEKVVEPYDVMYDSAWVGAFSRKTIITFSVPLWSRAQEQEEIRAQKQAKTAAIDKLLHPSAGRPVEFEELILKVYYRIHYGILTREELGDYAANRKHMADEAGNRGAAAYWEKMRVLATGPLADVITQAKIKSVPLDELKAYVKQQIDAATPASNGGAGARDYWAGVAAQIEGPLPDRYLGDRQRFLWTQPGSKQEIDVQKTKIAGLENRLAELEKLAPELLTTDARTKEELRGSEPPHPPWSRIEANKKEITRLKEDIWIEKKLLVDLEKGLPPRR